MIHEHSSKEPSRSSQCQNINDNLNESNNQITPCQIGAENLAKYDDETGGSAFNVLIVFVDDKETKKQFINWKKDHGRGDWYVAKGIDMAQTYNVQYLDTKYDFDRNGIIKWSDIKPLEYSSIKPILAPLLEAQ